MIRTLRSVGCWSRVLLACLLLSLLTLVHPPAFAADLPESLLIGIEPEHNIFDQMERYRCLANYLSDQLDVEVKLTIMSRYGEVIKRFRSLALDGAFLTAYTATMGIKELHLEPVVNPVNLSGEATSQGYLFVRKDSGIREVKDMQGKSIVFVDPATMEGYLFPLAYLRQQGVTDLRNFFSRFSYSGSSASAVFTVLDGRADIGATKNTTFDKVVHGDPSISNELAILARSPKVPEITLCLKNEVAANLRHKMAAVLLQMEANADGREALKQFKALRFVKANATDFTKIEELEQEVHAVQESMSEQRQN